MKLSDVFKQFKNIQPDADFSRHSRANILLSPQNERRTMRDMFAFLHVIETGAAVALVGFFVLILTGSFSPTRSIAPIQYAVIDPAGLHAEAQAIDMQIQLARVSYSGGVAVTASAPESTALTAQATSSALSTSMVASTSSLPAAVANSATSSTATSTSISVDQALTQLEQ